MRIKSLTYKTQFWLFIIATLIFALICYQVAISKTRNLSNEINSQMEQLETALNSAAKLSDLQTRIDELNSMILLENIENDSQQSLLKIASSYCSKNDLVLIELPSIRQFAGDNYNLELMEIKVRGNYRNLLGLLYFLERQSSVGSIVSVKFNSETSFRTKIQRLYMRVTFKSISNVT